MSTTATTSAPDHPNPFYISPDEIEEHDARKALLGLLECDRRECGFGLSFSKALSDGHTQWIVRHNDERKTFDLWPPQPMAYTYIQEQRAPLGIKKRVNLCPRVVLEWVDSLHVAADEHRLDTDGWALHAAMLAGTA